MSTNTYLQDAIVRHQIYLQRYARGKGRELVSEIKKISREAEKAISKRFGLPESSSIVNTVSGILATSKLVEIATAELGDLAASEAAYMASLLDRATRADIVSIAPEVAISAATEAEMKLVSTTGKTTISTVDELVDGLSSGINTRAAQSVRAGIVEGASNQEIAKRVKDIIGGSVTRKQAESVVITVTNHVTSQARMAVVDANSSILQGEEFVATLDRRTTLICIFNDGKVYPVNSGPIPPLHYRCRSVRVPKVLDKFGLSGLVGERPAVGSEGVTVVPGNTTYQSFLRRQSKEFQDDVLGEEKANLWRSGKVSIDSFVDSSGKVLTLKELKEIQ